MAMDHRPHDPEASTAADRGDASLAEEPVAMVRSRAFRAERAWGALDIAAVNGISTRLLGTDQPCRWHVNDGEAVFAVLDGRVEMRFRIAGRQRRVLLQPGDLFVAGIGCEHVAHPLGEARMLVVEREGSA